MTNVGYKQGHVFQQSGIGQYAFVGLQQGRVTEVGHTRQCNKCCRYCTAGISVPSSCTRHRSCPWTSSWHRFITHSTLFIVYFCFSTAILVARFWILGFRFRKIFGTQILGLVGLAGVEASITSQNVSILLTVSMRFTAVLLVHFQLLTFDVSGITFVVF